MMRRVFTAPVGRAMMRPATAAATTMTSSSSMMVSLQQQQIPQQQLQMRNFRFEPRVREYQFLYDEVLDYYKHYKELGISEDDLSKDLIESMMEECAKYSSTVLFPLLQSGDKEGCTLKNGVVTTPKGFKEAWNIFVESGWQGISSPKAFGGQGLPSSVSLVHKDMMATANWPFFMYPGLSAGAISTLSSHGTPEQKELYLRKIIEGTWTGTMCLTEPHCGTDLAQVKTKAEPTEDGKYKITGTKIFISSGDHDLTENIVHIVLARLPNAPEGTKGISLFVCPRHLVKEDGSLETKRNVECAGLEKKMGIHGNATAQLAFEGSIGYLVGEPHTGMKKMFTFMNAARIGTAIQGVAHTEIAFQNALWYTQERRSMRALEGTQESDKVADAIISHGDVREKVLFCKAIADAGRAFTLDLGQYVDKYEAASAKDPSSKETADIEAELGFYTPIAKGVLTELGVEAASAAMQCYGGHGYIQGHGVEQNLRDARIATIYEGTTAVQALDFIARKVLLSKTNQMGRFQARVKKVVQPRLFSGGVLGRGSRQMFGALLRLSATQATVGMTALSQKQIVGTAATDFLYAAGYITLGYYHLRMAAAAQKKVAAGEDPSGFYQSKIDVCEFYFERVFPRYRGHLDTATKSPSSVFKAKIEHLMFKN